MSYCTLQKFTFLYFSLPSFEKLTWNLELRLSLAVILIKFDFCCVWPRNLLLIFSWFSGLLYKIYQISVKIFTEIWHMNLFCNVEQVWLVWPLIYMPLWHFSGPEADFYCFERQCCQHACSFQISWPASSICCGHFNVICFFHLVALVTTLVKFFFYKLCINFIIQDF